MADDKVGRRVSIGTRLRRAWAWRYRAYEVRHFARQVQKQRLVRPFVVIAMPGSLHVAWLALSKVPPEISRLVVLNGMEKWEQRLARKLFRGCPIVACRALMDHDEVLDLLFENLQTDFGILDYDCFVLDPKYFELMRRLAPGVLMNACFSRIHPMTGRRVPETFFLFFDRSAIRRLRARYGVGCKPTTWAELPSTAAAALASGGLREGELPEAHKNYFDTLRVLMMLGEAEKMTLAFIADFPATPTPNGEIFHVGGISNPLKVDGIWRFRGVYLWRRALECCPFQELRDQYSKIYGTISATDHRATYHGWSMEVGEEFFTFCDELLSDVDACTVGRLNSASASQ